MRPAKKDTNTGNDATTKRCKRMPKHLMGLVDIHEIKIHIIAGDGLGLRIVGLPLRFVLDEIGDSKQSFRQERTELLSFFLVVSFCQVDGTL